MASTPPYSFVDEQQALDDAVAVLASSPSVGVDTEADSRHHYPEKVCLLQLSDGARTYLVDTLAGLDYGALGELFLDRAVQKVLHGADFDLRGLHRDFGFTFANCYDTSIAARFAGIERFGLASLLEEVLDVRIPKDQRLRRADWSRRPLENDALSYAASDVTHLPELRSVLHGRVRELGRELWVAEECERLTEVRYTPPDPDTAWLSVKGSHVLDGRGLAVLKALHDFREAEALRLDRPPAYVLPAQALVYLAAHRTAPIEDVPGMSATLVRRYGRGIRAAVKAGTSSPPLQRPRPPQPLFPRLTREEAARFTRLKRWRAGLGVDLGVDPSILWPMRSLERLARAPGSLDAECASVEVRAWQRERFAGLLRRELEG
ncbi:MAG: HRDC domain-containing protein [Chloroflexota bacterium]|nr:HRDC domain-containing protein [Chloroflexota bacterium]MDE2886417.1 HRDC domain-containing protein [Chloroflexota bacterium]